MACDCRIEVNKKISEALKVKGEIINFEIMSGKTFDTFQYKDERGRKQERLLIHTYCPICGKKY